MGGTEGKLEFHCYAEILIHENSMEAFMGLETECKDYFSVAVGIETPIVINPPIPQI